MLNGIDKTQHLQNCISSPGFFPSPLTVYPDLDFCYSHFIAYRMTPSVRHRAIEVHCYYYYPLEFWFLWSLWFLNQLKGQSCCQSQMSRQDAFNNNQFLGVNVLQKYGCGGVKSVGKGGKTRGECVKEHMKLLGLQPEWAIFMDIWRDLM